MTMTWKMAIKRVLRDEGSAMHYADIAEQIVERELRDSVGATPANSVGSVLSTEIQENGQQSEFERVSSGEYILRNAKKTTSKADDQEKTAKKLIQAFGMFWRRNSVNWTSSPKLFGRQSVGSDPVDFSDQRGVYLLHDRNVTVYVGQVYDRSLGRRLYEHTKDRLDGRWNRFSWFGIKPVNENGALQELDTESGIDLANCVNALESVLIEAIESPQNRRQGDGFKGIEYIQMKDPALEKQQVKEMLREIEDQIDTV